ncbi:MAG: heparinase II/III domain-containing protein [Armatimonadota bacterium]
MIRRGLGALITAGVIFMAAGLASAQDTNMTGRTEHPCVLVNAEMVEGLRARAADEAPNRFGFSMAEIWREHLAQADGFLDAPPYHYSVNIQRDPAREPVIWEYTLSEEAPPRHEGINYPPWTAMTQEQRDDAITVRLKSLSFAYLITQEPKYAERAKEIALKVAQWAWWSDPDYGRGIACLDTGHLTKTMAIFYDWCHDTLSDAERTMIREAIADKGCEAIMRGIDGYAPETNGYAVLAAGLAAGGLAIRGEDERGGVYLQRAIDATETSLDLSGADGGQFEGPMYGTYLLDSLAHVLDGVVAADVDAGLMEHPFLETMDEYVISQMTPDGHEMPTFGDGSPVRGYPETMSVLANNGNSAAAWYLEQTGQLKPNTIHQFMRFDPDALQPEQPSFNPSRPLVDVGLVSLKAGYEPHTPYLCMKSGPPETSVGHAHFDSNAIVLSFLGEWLVSDRGYRARHDPPATKFSQGAMGHSTLVIDIDEAYMQSVEHPDPGHDQVSRTGARIEEFFSCDAIDYVRGEAAPTYNTDELHVLDSFARQIFYLKPHFYVIVDDIAAPEAHAYTVTVQAPANGLVEHVDGDAWEILGQSARLNAFFASPAGLVTEALTYPGAERYGSFIAATTNPAAEARIITLLHPDIYDEGGLLANTGFERGMTGWRPRANEDLPNHVVDEQVAHSGDASGRIERSGYYYSGRVQVQPGDLVTASAWLKTEDVSEKGGTLRIHWWDNTDDCFATDSTDASGPEEWTLVELEAVAPEGAMEADIGLYFSDPTGVGWWDDVRLETDAERVEIVREGVGDVTPLEGGARGMAATVGDERVAVVTSGDAIDIGGATIAHDGEFAAVTMTEDGWRTLYLQGGSTLSIDGEEVLALPEMATIALWHDEAGEVQATMRTSLAPHAEDVPADEIDLEAIMR